MTMLAILIPMMADAGSPFPSPLDAALRDAKEIYLATRRTNGERSSIVPVWFMYTGDAVYFATSPHSYKAKRIGRGSLVDVWVGSRGGPHFTAKGELLKDAALAQSMEKHYRSKYWIAWLGFFRPNPSRLARGEIVIVRLIPTAGPQDP